METLFDTIERSSEESAGYTEGHFTYLNRIARVEYIHARKVLDEWYLEYFELHPVAAQELRGRFRLPDDDHHYAALTELYIHHLLIKNGYSTIPHPHLKDSSARPDFLAVKDADSAFYIEVMVLYGGPDARRRERFEAQIKDAIDEIRCPDFFISLNLLSVDQNTQPPIGKIRRDAEKRIALLDYDAVCRDIEVNNKYPEWRWQSSGWEIEFRISPVSERGRRVRSEDSRVLGTTMTPVRWIALDSEIKRGVSGKWRKYGKPKLPFVMAVNIVGDSIFCDNNTIMSAIFGPETTKVGTGLDGKHIIQHGRTMDGVFIHPKDGWRSRGLSALLVLKGLTGPIFHAVEPVLWHHPKALNPVAINLFNVVHKVFNKVTGRMEDVRGGEAKNS
ncbi:MAG: hypothetical protein Q7S47_03055 [bacterium]|nr:hypothetical protein [bacterium]